MTSTSSGGTVASPPPKYIATFSSLVASLPKYSKQQQPSRFVKKIDEILSVVVKRSSRNLALRFTKNILIGKFIGTWPSPKSMALWIEKKWRPLIKGWLSLSFCSEVFFSFMFEEKEDKDLILRSGPYFMGSIGLYLNSWTPDFYLENDISSVVLVWLRLPYLPLHCWNNETIRNIGNTLGKYIDRA